MVRTFFYFRDMSYIKYGKQKMQLTIVNKEQTKRVILKSSEISGKDFVDMLGLFIQESGFLTYEIINDIEKMTDELKKTLVN